MGSDARDAETHFDPGETIQLVDEYDATYPHGAGRDVRTDARARCLRPIAGRDRRDGCCGLHQQRDSTRSCSSASNRRSASRWSSPTDSRRQTVRSSSATPTIRRSDANASAGGPPIHQRSGRRSSIPRRARNCRPARRANWRSGVSTGRRLPRQTGGDGRGLR